MHHTMWLNGAGPATESAVDVAKLRHVGAVPVREDGQEFRD